ncbi:hypothetical protein M408DRAFT_327517 [Serendipita vermifera MAFF 305830]|uniref:DUF3533 domain-containing protein n=1 Tax=Serendipita vermifera MAFF 305830 TaxID=933852 RepID=A0A0C3BID1_SERVB|nr:hypothetical protein M408DRAFT_327517 [Serendipita vermifera MAFF 305830]
MSASETPTRKPSKEDLRTVTTVKQSEAEPQFNTPKHGLKKYSYSFWAPEIAHLRALYFKIMIMSTILLTVIVWICLPVYWGSLWKGPELTGNIHALVINRDDGIIGSTVAGALINSTTSGSQHLGWEEVDPSTFATDEDVAEAIVDEAAWIAVVITSGATSRLAAARATGDTSYNPMGAISVYYAQARNEVATGNYLMPITQAVLNRVTVQLGAQLSAQYLQSIAGNQTAVGLLARAPLTISNPVSFQLFNLRPYTSQVASAVTLVGFIYMIILSFYVTMFGAGAREVIAPYLKMSTYLKLRLIVPLILYVPISLIYSMISLPFNLPFGAKYTYAGGFFLFWCLVFVGMCSLGLATEAALTVLTTRFVAFFLIPFIIINVSVTVVPNDVQPWFYKYGLGFPISNMSQAVRTIIFNTKNHLGLNFGVLLAWTALSLITVPLLSFIMRRKEMREEATRTLPNEHDEEIREDQERLDFGVGTTAHMTPSLERRVEQAEKLDRNDASRDV